MIICPFDGPIGDVIAILGTGALYTSIVAVENIVDSFTKDGKKDINNEINNLKGFKNQYSKGGKYGK